MILLLYEVCIDGQTQELLVGYRDTQQQLQQVTDLAEREHQHRVQLEKTLQQIMPGKYKAQISFNKENCSVWGEQ